ncbi:hypothetical protein BGZ61DRAFT_480420 [Ilyonectria robusta]|uniref:uncharacterized protein n=1 Tax=Ilyonectria robusta TaxID=1079257 RepID=UPI001E8D51AB|nr:uncharacterized protein BGZ61DRAFT_480420 [Ilyonectria robusta]KAH8684149.1 hypothetical protein BGZ61DRAFT_480420 [Ilyonectria robusta]
MTLLLETVHDDIVSFNESKCWTDMASETLPYGPAQFIILVESYLWVICDKAHKQMKAAVYNAKLYDRAKLCMKGLDKTTTLLGLCNIADISLEKGKKEFRTLKTEFDTLYHESGHTEELDSDQVVNISPREARIWCQLNTRDMHNKIKSSHGNPETLISLLRGVIQLPLSHNPFQGEPKIWLPIPYMFFTCLGIDKIGKMLHPWVHVGATQERLNHWPEFCIQRKNARDAKIGESLIKACHDRNESRKRLECGMSNTEKEVLRFKVMTGDMSSLAPEQSAIAESWTKNSIRSCKSHLGQAFKQDAQDRNSYGPVDSCYQCKQLFGYDEIQERNPKRVLKFRAGQKEEKISPHSCCEVPASVYCKLNSL